MSDDDKKGKTKVRLAKPVKAELSYLGIHGENIRILFENFQSPTEIVTWLTPEEMQQLGEGNYDVIA